MKTSIKLVGLVFFLCQFFYLKAQLIPIPLDHKFEESKVIIEGKVVSVKSYEASDGRIYTENTIEILSFIKGHIGSPYLSVITMGGKTEQYEVTWTHLAKLKLNQQGVFFLTETKRPKNERPQNSFELFPSSQGFYEVFKDDEGYRVISELERYDDPKDFYEKIGVRYSAINGGLVAYSLADEPCLVFKIIVSPTSSFQSSVSLNADIYVKLNEGFKYLYKSELVVKYSGDFFGQNIVASGNLVFSEGELVTPSYNLSMTDYADDKLEVKLDGLTTDVSELEQLGTDFRQIASMQISVIGWSENTPIEWDSNNESVSNLYIDANTELIKAFECAEVLLEEVALGGGIEITDFIPSTVAAGVSPGSSTSPSIAGSVIITGAGFSDPLPGEVIPDGHYVKFETVGGSWIAPFEGDYLSWTDTEIFVKVPSFGYDNNSDNIISDLNKDIACTGRIRVCKDGFFNCGTFATSDEELYVAFSARNVSQTNSDNLKESVRVLLRDANSDGGYTLFFEDQFKNDADALNAFKRALTTWRCNTRVNFEIDETNPFPGGNGNCFISFEDLPVGVSTTLGSTGVFGPGCGANPSTDFSTVRDFEIMFNENINWDGTPGSDLESTALHELGHAHLLNHTNNGEDKVMIPSKTIIVHDLHMDDENGGVHVATLSSSTIDPQCPYDEMILINVSDCIISSNSYIIEGEDVEVLVFPNPSSNQFSVQLKSDSVKYYGGRINLSDQFGRILLTNKVNSDLIHFDVSNLSSGLYFLTIQTESGSTIFLNKIQKK